MPATVVDSEEINFRVDFPLLCNARGVKVAVELGTDVGGFAVKFMERFDGDMLYCVDDYKQYEWLGQRRDADLMMAVHALAPFHPRVKIVHRDTVAAANDLPSWIACDLGFVYVDASHRYQDVLDDMHAWWQHLRPDGILAGHDFDDERHPEVAAAVRYFAESRDRVVRLTAGDVKCTSWYMYKDEPETLHKRFFLEDSALNPIYKSTEPRYDTPTA